MPLSENVDAAYPDSGGPGRKVHQQDHDTIHGFVNAMEAAYDAAVAGGFGGTVAEWFAAMNSNGSFHTVGETVEFSGSGLSLTSGRVEVSDYSAVGRYTDQEAAGDLQNGVDLDDDFGDWIASPDEGGLCKLKDGLYHCRFTVFHSTPAYFSVSMLGFLGGYDFTEGLHPMYGDGSGQISEITPARTENNTFGWRDVYPRIYFYNSSRVHISSGLTNIGFECRITPIFDF